jgi:hypothetical protein
MLFLQIGTFPLFKGPGKAQSSENQPPTISLINPDEQGIYFRDFRIVPASRILIFGYFTIKVNAGDDNGIKQVEFYIDGALKNISTTIHHCGSYMWVWNERSLIPSRHTIRVVAVDNENLITDASCEVMLLNVPGFHPLYP